jgi:DNA-binding PadR family transcriptional regulator
MAVLALLTERPMHPYEMHRLLLQRKEDRLVKLRRGTLYHTVVRLAADGLADEKGTDRNGNRPVHTVYGITDAGRTALRERIGALLAVPEEEFPAFPVALAEAHTLPTAEVADLLDARLERLRAHLRRLDDGVAAARAQDIPRRVYLDVEYRQQLLHAQIAWLTELRRELHEGDIPWQ